MGSPLLHCIVYVFMLLAENGCPQPSESYQYGWSITWARNRDVPSIHVWSSWRTGTISFCFGGSPIWGWCDFLFPYLITVEGFTLQPYLSTWDQHIFLFLFPLSIQFYWKYSYRPANLDVCFQIINLDAGILALGIFMYSFHQLYDLHGRMQNLFPPSCVFD